LRLSKSIQIYIGLVLVLAISNALQVMLSSQSVLPSQSLPAPLPVVALVTAALTIVLHGGLGFAGLKLAEKLGFSSIWNPAISNRQRFLAPGFIGVSLGILIITIDIAFSLFNGVGRIQHPPFPTSIFASLSAGIDEEMLFRLFFISFWAWLISSVILRGNGRKLVFWIITTISALVFAISHLPGVMVLYNYSSFNLIPPVFIFEIIIVNGVISFFAAIYMRKYGFLAAVGIHFWTDIVWHVLWGALPIP
jgi:hypothetical protein